MLQVGGVHAAVIDAPPGFVLLTPPFVVTAATLGWVEVHVSGTPVITWPFESVTVGSTVNPAPFAPVNVVPPDDKASVIICTGHVVNVCSGEVWPTELLVPLIEAEISVAPGVFAVNSAMPFCTPFGPVNCFTVATCGKAVFQLKGPTNALTSDPLLKACA
jgi:hypothetical protein